MAAVLAGSFTPAPVLVPAYPNAEPALWVVNDEDTVIYLFGTFHALDGQADWFNDEVRTAFSASHELVLETLVPREPLSTGNIVRSIGRSQGMSTDLGADAVLRHAAEGSGKRVGGLETFEYQLRMFSRMPGARLPGNARQAGQSRAAVAALLSRLQAAWNRGDSESFTPMLERMRANSPETYRLMFTDRNQRWAGWIAQRLQQPGTVFVAVGAGHLAGKDSVQHKLAEAGLRSERLN
jgi:uncharacterized protein YbaP (TraB family)